MNLSLKHDFPNPIGIVLLVIYIVKMQSIEMDYPITFKTHRLGFKPEPMCKIPPLKGDKGG